MTPQQINACIVGAVGLAVIVARRWRNDNSRTGAITGLLTLAAVVAALGA